MQTQLPSQPAKGQNKQAAAKQARPSPAGPSQQKPGKAPEKPNASDKSKKVKVQAFENKDCAILLENPSLPGKPLTPVIAAKSLNRDSIVSSRFKSGRPRDCNPFRGFTIEVDLPNNQVRNETFGFGVKYEGRRADCDADLATKYIITVKFPRDTAFSLASAKEKLPSFSELFPQSKYDDVAVIHATLPEDSEATVEGFGVPFRDCDTRRLEDWVNGNQPIAAGYSLADVIRQKKFFFFLDFSVYETNKKFFAQPLPEPFRLPYKTFGMTGLQDFLKSVNDNLGHQFQPRFILDSDEDHNVAVCHAVVQDMMWIHEVSLQIKSTIRPLYFAVLDETSVEVDGKAKHYVVMSLTADFMDVYGDAWRRLAKSGEIQLSFYESESGTESISEWDDKIIEHPETIPRFVECHVPVAEKDLVMQIKPSLREPDKPSPLDKRVFGDRLAANRAILQNQALATAIVQEALPEDQERWAGYLERRHLSFGMLAAGPGTGKTTMMAAATIAMAAKFGKVLCSAPTHVATTNFAERIYKRSAAGISRYKMSIAEAETSPRCHQLTVVRGYKMEFELEAVKALLKEPNLGDAAVPSHKFRGNSGWKLHLSLAYWLLMVLGSPAVRELQPDDSEAIRNLYGMACTAEMQRLRDVARGRITWEAYNTAGALDDGQLTGFMRRLLGAVDVLCITPAASHNIMVYRTWKQIFARSVAIDEAGNMSCADLFDVWGNTLLPCFLGGDPKQLPPAVMSLMDKDAAGNYRNRFAKYGRVSALLKFQAMGMPMYRLNQQLRMARGMFDTPAAVIYPDTSFLYSSN